MTTVPTSDVQEIPEVAMAEKEPEQKATPVVSLADSLQRLQSASGAKKRPASQSTEQQRATVDPKPKAKSFVSKMTKKKQTPVMKRPASSSKCHRPAEMIYPPQGNGKKMPAMQKRIEMCPKGCSRCRGTAGHAASCWLKKGWTL